MTIKDWKNPDYKRIVKLRIQRLKRIREDKEFYNNLLWYYKIHPADFINDWGTTYDPRRKYNKLMPFILFPKQIDLIGFIKENLDKSLETITSNSNCLIEKSRGVGLTWLCVGFAVWLWLFHPQSSIGFGSMKASLVDDLEVPDCIFEKIRMFLKYLPVEFLPRGFDITKDCHKMKIINRANGSTITGEGGDEIGRGGRKTIYFKDESPCYERPLLIERALAENTDCQVDVGTPKGTGNPYYQKRVGGITPVFTFHWRSDPRKDEKWYQAKCKEYQFDPVLVAQELDIDYNASAENVTIPAEWVQAAVDFNLPASGMKIAAFDPADDGGDENCLIDRHGVVVKHVDGWRIGNVTQSTRKVYGTLKDRKIKLCNYDSIGVGAGVKGEFWAITEENKGKVAVVSRGINTGASPYKGNFAPGKLNSDMFFNLKAQLWWELRLRFFKTYNMKKGIRNYPLYELISIPDDGQLILELSQQPYFFRENGKIGMVSKKDLKKKGVRSPNRADALVMCFARIAGIDYDMLTQM